jgi:hypothetical protein
MHGLNLDVSHIAIHPKLIIPCYLIQHKTECKKSGKTRRILSAPNLERACNTPKTCLTVGHKVALNRTLKLSLVQ